MTAECRVGDQRRGDAEQDDSRDRPQPLPSRDHRTLADGRDRRHAGRAQSGHEAREHGHEHAEE